MAKLPLLESKPARSATSSPVLHGLADLPHSMDFFVRTKLDNVACTTQTHPPTAPKAKTIRFHPSGFTEIPSPGVSCESCRCPWRCWKLPASEPKRDIIVVCDFLVQKVFPSIGHVSFSFGPF